MYLLVHQKYAFPNLITYVERGGGFWVVCITF
jgi:hypothetical protein